MIPDESAEQSVTIIYASAVGSSAQCISRGINRYNCIRSYTIAYKTKKN